MKRTRTKRVQERARHAVAAIAALVLALGVLPASALAQEGEAGGEAFVAAQAQLTAASTSVGILEFLFDEPQAGAIAPSTVTVTTNPPLAANESAVPVRWMVVQFANGSGALIGELGEGDTFQAGYGYYALAQAPSIMSIYAYDEDTLVLYNGKEAGTVSIDGGSVNVPMSQGFGPLVANPTTKVSSYDLTVDEPVVGAAPDTSASVSFTCANGTTIAGTGELAVSWGEYSSPNDDGWERTLGEGDTFQEGKYYQLFTVRDDGAFSVLPEGHYYNLLDSTSYQWFVNGNLRTTDDAAGNYFGPLGEEASYPYTITYSYDDTTQTATVTGLTSDSTVEGNLVIPATVRNGDTTYTVTAIGANAFKNRSGFTGTLTMPDTIESIHASAFYNCSGFTGTLRLPANLKSVGNEAFWRCTGFTGSWQLPEGLETLGERAFLDCYSIGGTVVVPASLKSIGDSCFYMSNGHYSGWKGVGGLAFAQGSQLERIGAHAFDGNWDLRGGLTFPDSLTEIGDYAFASTCVVPNGTADKHLQGTLTLPRNIKTIGKYAFNVCGFSGDLVIPESLTAADASIGKGAFYSAGFTGQLVLPEGLACVPDECFCNSDFTGALTLPGTLATVGVKAFGGLGKLEGDLVIPASLTTIGQQAFYGFGGTGTLSLPDTLTAIGPSAFSGAKCTGALVIPDSVQTIGSSAFDECLGFTSLKLPNNPNFTRIEDDTFGTTWYGFSNYEKPQFSGELVIPDSVTYIGKEAFQSCANFTGTPKLPRGLVEIGNEAFINCTGLTGLELPDSLTTIGNEAFSNCTGLTGNLVIPANVKSIGEEAFYSCTGLNGMLTLPAGLETIGAAAFSYCRNLTGEVNIPDSVTSLGRGAFQYCQKISGYSLPDGITSIPSSLFYGCSGMTGELEIPSTVESIGSYAFCGCSGLTGALSIPNTVSSIGDTAFADCTGLTGALTLPNGITKIGSNTFENCSGLDGALTLPSGLKEIDYEAFEGCSGLSGTLTLPNTLTYIGSSAFSGCAGFTGLDLSQMQYDTINSWVFAGCTGLSGDLTLPGTVTRIYGGAFEGCTGLTGTLTIPETVTRGSANGLYGSHFSTIVNNGSYAFNGQISPDGSYYYVDAAGAAAETIATGTYTRVGGSAPAAPATLAAPKDYKLSAMSFTYDGKAKTPGVTVTDANGNTIAKSNYSVAYSGNTNAGTATAKVTFTGNYATFGSKSLTFAIAPKAVKPTVTLAKTSYTYTGKAIKPAVAVKAGSTVLAPGDYSVSYASGRKAPGSYAVKVTLKGNYTGTAAARFTIVPKGTKVAKVTAGKKAFTVNWKKQATQATGYQIQYSTNKSFKSGNKTLTVGKVKTVSAKVAKLKSKKTYYVRVRTYKTVGKVKYYSAWSAKKSVKVK